MVKLAEIASESGCSIIVVRHLTKVAANDPMHRGSGSIAEHLELLLARHAATILPAGG